jgi:hypothetical protein
MQILTDVFSSVLAAISALTWRDAVEIAFISYGIYRFLVWLNQDFQKNLVLYFYGYCLALFCSHYLHLMIVSQTLLILVPVMLCIFIVVHQHSLQKNFVALKTLQPPHTTEYWIDELIRSSLYAMNTSKNLIWVIERNDSLAYALEASSLFYADLKKELIDLLLDAYTTETILWVQHTGKLVATNVSWKIPADARWISPEAEHLEPWQKEALIVSAKTDAIIVRSCAVTRLLSVITEEKHIPALSAHQLTLLLKRIMNHTTVTTSLGEGISYASQSSRTTSEQQLP